MPRSSNPAARSTWKILLALLCIVLVMATATVELTHSHATGALADCARCVVAHIFFQTDSAPALLVLFARLASVALAARVLVLAKATLFALFPSPPPVCRDDA